MANVNSDLMRSFVEKKRIRQMNYRGTVISTVANITTTTTGNTAAEDIIYLCPIPYRSMIRSIHVLGDKVIPADTFINVYALNADGVTIGAKVNTKDFIKMGLTTVNVSVDVSNRAIRSNTVYTHCCGTDGKPNSVFAPYAEGNLGILGMTGTAVPAGNYTIIVNYVEHAPSSGPFDNTISVGSIT